MYSKVFWFEHFLKARAEFLKKIRSFFVRNDDIINSFWNLLTFRQLRGTNWLLVTSALPYIDILTDVHKIQWISRYISFLLMYATDIEDWLWCKFYSMTYLFVHKVAQPTKWRFLPENLSQLFIFDCTYLHLIISRKK